MRTLVIVDDHAPFCATARDLFTLEDYVVLGEAHSGAEAVELVGRVNPDVVLLDVGLPDMSGFEVAVRLTRSGAAGPSVVLVSAREWDETGPKVKGCGARGLIPKGELTVAAVEAMLEGSA